MKEAIGRVVGVTDEMGVVVACSELNQIDSIKEGVQTERMSNSRSFIRNGYTYKGFTNSKRNDFYVFVEGTDEMADKFATILSVSMQSLK
ncbi:MAG: PucR family transcriptional regulator, partial [Oscillospiraceae bacterium]|nr:PucR family transcriptional regulator [Oscillospiraceae bacterium]